MLSPQNRKVREFSSLVEWNTELKTSYEDDNTKSFKMVQMRSNGSKEYAVVLKRNILSYIVNLW